MRIRLLLWLMAVPVLLGIAGCAHTGNSIY
jgi:hypothetical protein